MRILIISGTGLISSSITRELGARGKVEDSDLDATEDRLIAAWRRLGDAMARELAPAGD